MIELAEPLPVIASWAETCAKTRGDDARLHRLSPAERVVVAQLCRGLSNKEIAAALGKSEATVKNQVSTCLQKLRVPTRTRLMVLLQ